MIGQSKERSWLVMKGGKFPVTPEILLTLIRVSEFMVNVPQRFSHDVSFISKMLLYVHIRLHDVFPLTEFDSDSDVLSHPIIMLRLRETKCKIDTFSALNNQLTILTALD